VFKFRRGVPLQIDINADLGESFGNWRMGNDEALIPLVQTINVACGFHAGDPGHIRHTVELAKENGVAVGAHPGYPDLLGFGRRALKVRPDDAYAYVAYQVGALRAFLEIAGLTLHHVKPHGALDDAVYADEDLADAVAQALADLGVPMVYRAALPGRDAFVEAVRAHGIRVVFELYPDLDYDADGLPHLAQHIHPRTGAEIASQVRQMLTEGTVTATTGEHVAVQASSICIHGDGPNSVEAARLVGAVVEELGHELCAQGASEPPPG
jgi:5-oxoprolinase (ATP-hydrolysing) subunit A